MEKDVRGNSLKIIGVLICLFMLLKVLGEAGETRDNFNEDWKFARPSQVKSDANELVSKKESSIGFCCFAMTPNPLNSELFYYLTHERKGSQPI